MKRHVLAAPLALLAAAFLLGCQEQASSPVGLEGLGPQFAKKTCEENPNQGSCKDGDGDFGGTVLAEIKMPDPGLATPPSGLVTDETKTAVGSFKDGRKKFEFNRVQSDGVAGIHLATAMTNTYAAGVVGGSIRFDMDKNILDGQGKVHCFRGGRVGEGDADPTKEQLELLFNQLVDDNRERGNFFGVVVHKTADGEPSKDGFVQFGYPNETFNIHGFQFRVFPLTVTTTGVDIKSGLMLVFTGGSIRLGASTGNTPSGFNLTCPNDFDVITMFLKSQ